MKFFKHFCDAHQGRSMTALMNEFGLEGYAAYFILIEMCAEKLEKPENGELTADHCNFIFNERVVREKLRMRSTKVELFLNYCSSLDLLLFTKVKDEFNFSIPNLLKYLDRDSKRARSVRALSAPKIKIEDKDKDKEITSQKRATLPELALIWNENCGALPKVSKTNKNRNQKCALRMSEASVEEWTEAIKRIAKSSFCRGENDRNWQATFDWILRPETYLKVIEGKFDDKTTSGSSKLPNGMVED
jgi:hypothetical protein